LEPTPVASDHKRLIARPATWLNRNQWIAVWLVCLMTFLSIFMLISRGDKNVPETEQNQNVNVQNVMVILSSSPTSTAMLPANVTATPWPAPRIKVETLGAGGPHAPLAVALRVTNLTATPVTLFGAMFDTDPRQQRLYPQVRIELDPFEESHAFTFVGWWPSACYIPTLLGSRSETGLEQLRAWFSDSNSRARLLHAVTATGDVSIVYQGELVCP